MNKSPHKILLAPSLLAANHARLAQSLEIIHAVHCEWLHLDIMDGHFVPNLSFGPQVLKDLRDETDLFFDTHLMLAQPDKYIEPFADAGAQLITIHIEAESDVRECFQKIRRLGCQVGLSLNPGTPAEAVLDYLDEIDLLLAMTVQPGFGGQSFRQEVLPKIEVFAEERRKRGLQFRLEVDGGVDATTAPLCTKAGADTLVAGSAFFKAEDPSAFKATVEREE